MGYTEVASLDAEVTISLGGVNRKTGKKNPTAVEGYYLGSRTVANKKGESKIHFFKFGTTNKDIIADLKGCGVRLGETVGVWGKTDSDRKLGAVVPGTMTLISFDKMQSTPNGEMYKYIVKHDQDNMIDVSGLDSQSSDGKGGSGFEDNESNASSYSSDEDTSDDDANVNAAAIAAAERKAKVQALLGKGKKA